MPNIFPNQNKEIIILVVLVICSQVNDMMIKINKLFHKLAVAHCGTYKTPLVISLFCWFFRFLGNWASSMLFAIWNTNSGDCLWLSVLRTTERCTRVWKKLCTLLHPLQFWAIQTFWAVPVPCGDVEDLFKETELWFCSVMSSSGELLTSWLGSMKHHFEYGEPFWDDLLHQNDQHKQRNIFWLSLFFGPMWALIPHVPSLNTQWNKYVGVNMYYLFVKLRVRSDT